MRLENRTYARATVQAKVIIQTKEMIIEGELRDLCMDGAFVVAAAPLQRNDLVTVKICRAFSLSGCNYVKAKVARVTATGVGLHFDHLLVDAPC